MLVPAFTRKPLLITLLGGGVDCFERHETIIAPGAATSGLNLPLRSGPGLVKSEIALIVRPTPRSFLKSRSNCSEM